MISVVIPVYNTKKYLSKCVNSVINQTYKDIEIILVDDGSTDGSGQLCDDYMRIDSRIRVYHKPNKSGVGGGRNTGIDHARGEFITFIDSDDYIIDEYIEKMVNTQSQTGADIVCVGVEKIWESELKKEKSIFPEAIYTDLNDMLIALGKRDIDEGAWAKLYRMSLFDNVRYPENVIHEDVLTTHFLFSEAHKIVQTKECMYKYLQRSGSIMHSETTKDKHFKALYQRYCDICDLVNKKQLEIRVKNEYFKRLYNSAFISSYTRFWKHSVSSNKCCKLFLEENRDYAKNINFKYCMMVHIPRLYYLLSRVCHKVSRIVEYKN